MSTQAKIDTIIENFILNKITGIEFEKQFSDIYDFEEYHINEEEVRYYETIRILLERFSPFGNDIKKFSNYYISENLLKQQIRKLKRV